MKGDREARAILIRDSNRTVATAVVHNPKITDQEVESIASMRTVSDEVLRLISMNRAWARAYPIIHNLARNPRDRKSTRLNSSHANISYAVFCLKKKHNKSQTTASLIIFARQ